MTWWPVLGDEGSCREWVGEVWPQVRDAVADASPGLASRVEAILDGRVVTGRDVERATVAVVSYVLRFGRSTPFGLFAGVAPVTVGEQAQARVGSAHRPVARVDCGWLRQVVEDLETCPELLDRLRVVVDTAAETRGDRLVVSGVDSVSVRRSDAVELVRAHASSPVRFADLSAQLTAAFPSAGDPGPMLRTLVTLGLLITELRAPATVTDPLGWLVEALARAGAAELAPVRALAAELAAIHDAVQALNRHPHPQPHARARARVTERMSVLAAAPRGPLSTDLRADTDVVVPAPVVREIERAAEVLARCAREHTGRRAWRDYATAFRDRYGTATLVPLRDVLDPGGGLGWPGGYPLGPPEDDRHMVSDRDRLLWSWITQATASGRQEIEMDAGAVEALAAAGGDPTGRPAHVDLGAQIHAPDLDALQDGRFTVTVSPARVAGTLTARFAPLVPEAGLGEILAELPPTTAGARPVQVSFVPAHARAENVARTPCYLPDVVSVGEHRHHGYGRGHGGGDVIGVEDLAVTATRRRLHLVSLSSLRVLDPVIVHALALKQQPPVARFLGELSRALDTGRLDLDWGPAFRGAPFRPRLRHHRVILSPARWTITTGDLPSCHPGRGAPGGRAPGDGAWDAGGGRGEADAGLSRWRDTWCCPSRVQLRDFDQHLPLDLDVAAHRELLYRHLSRHGEATLIESPAPDADGWIGGRAHRIVLPLVDTGPRDRAPSLVSLPVLDRRHGQVPAAAGAHWLYAKLYLADHRFDTLLTGGLPALAAELAGRDWWFVRYPRTPGGHDADHLRLRIRTDPSDATDAAAVLTTVTGWADRMRARGELARLAVDTYYPEIGRYRVIGAAEHVFCADSRYVLACLTHPPDTDGGTRPELPGPALPGPALPGLALSGLAWTGLSLWDLSVAFLGGPDHAARWWSTQTPAGVPDRGDVDAVTRAVRQRSWPHASTPAAVAAALRVRADAVRAYHDALTHIGDPDPDVRLSTLLHMHHNRALGVDRDREAVCLRLARHAAAAHRARAQETTP